MEEEIKESEEDLGEKETQKPSGEEETQKTSKDEDKLKKMERLVYKALGEIETLKKERSSSKEEVVQPKVDDPKSYTSDQKWKEKVDLLIARPDLREHLDILEGFANARQKPLSEVAELEEVKEIISFREEKKRKAQASPETSPPESVKTAKDIAKMSEEEFRAYEEAERKKSTGFGI